jgi:predicted nuclease of restriction endonuclease-like (RecB) superfamily
MLSKRLTKDFGKGYTLTNLKYMRQFYLAFPIGHAVSDQLTWTHYRMILSVKNEQARSFYIAESARANWSTRELHRPH